MTTVSAVAATTAPIAIAYAAGREPSGLRRPVGTLRCFLQLCDQRRQNLRVLAVCVRERLLIILLADLLFLPISIERHRLTAVIDGVYALVVAAFRLQSVSADVHDEHLRARDRCAVEIDV